MSRESFTADTMTAAVIDQYGEADVLQVRQIQRPLCGAGQALVQVSAAGVNPIDWRIRNGSLRWLLPANFPVVLGFDVAGVVAEIGDDVTRGPCPWSCGDEVYAFLDNRHGGGYAEYAVASWDVLARKPVNLSFEEAAATPLAALTALQALRDSGEIRSGDSVLVNGASGGVGTFAVQLAVAFGATVTAVCSANNADLVCRLGATHFIDYQTEDFTASGASYDIVFDAVAKSSYRKCKPVLKAGGHYITTVPSLSGLFYSVVSRFSSTRRHVVLVRPNGADLAQITQMTEAGQVRPIIQRVYALSDAPAAHRESESGHVRGKLVLSICPDAC